MSNGDLVCPFRLNPRVEQASEIATCGRLQQLLQIGTHSACNVPRAACEECIGYGASEFGSIDGAFASILASACEQYLDSNSIANPANKDRAAELLKLGEQAIINTLNNQDPICELFACDVILYCEGNSTDMHRSIESVLNQQDVSVNLHLVVASPAANQIAAAYQDRWNVQVHFPDRPEGVFQSVHDLAPNLRSEFIALQHAGGISSPDRLVTAVGEMQRSGSNLVGSEMVIPGGRVSASLPTDAFDHSIPWPTWVLRRDLLIDLGGFADRDLGQDAELLYRARQSGARFRLLPFASVRLAEPWTQPAVGREPSYASRLGSLRHHARGYSHSQVSCDVVVPIYGQLDYVGQAIESVFEQEGAEAIVHLVDDASPESVESLYRYWGSHPRVRLYRNQRNVGQYVSLNNVSEFFETDLVAIQDGDDISLPDRLHVSGNLLRLCDADYFAATMEQFGQDEQRETEAMKRRFRRSFHPYGDHQLYFAMNPTACFRVSAFRRLGGYSDFGGRDRNRGGLDSEFMIRALYAGIRFAFSSSVVSRHRLHAQAATRNRETGFGTETRKFALAECRRRLALFRRTHFDPRSFGALGRYRNVTQRV